MLTAAARFRLDMSWAVSPGWLIDHRAGLSGADLCGVFAELFGVTGATQDRRRSRHQVGHRVRALPGVQPRPAAFSAVLNAQRFVDKAPPQIYAKRRRVTSNSRVPVASALSGRRK